MEQNYPDRNLNSYLDWEILSGVTIDLDRDLDSFNPDIQIAI